jgi:type VI secretion system secreted protein Hcp
VAFDAFLKLGDVKGGSTDADHKDEIVVREYSFGVSNTGSVGSASGGAGAGKATFTDLSFTMPMSVASPKLVLACASWTHYSDAVLTLRRAAAGKTGHEFFRVTLKTVLVSSYQNAGSSSDDAPHESVTLTFGAMKLEFVSQSPSGSTGPVASSGWDRTKNEPYNE